MRALISAAVAALAVALQLTVVDRMSLPGGAGPSLVLVTVAALALAAGSMTGMLTGFAAGLALDIAPPAGHLVGEDALVFCLVGYACGLAATAGSADGLPEQDRSAVFELGVTAAGAICGEALLVALGVMLSDPSVTWAAVRRVLPFAICYDVMLSPFVLLAVAAMLRLTGQSRRTAGALSPGPARRAVAIASPSPAPRLRFDSNLGAALLGGSVFGKPALAPSARARPVRGAAFSGLARPERRKSRPLPPAPGISFATGRSRKRATKLATQAPRFRGPGLLARLSTALRRPARTRTPGKGWASGASPRRTGGKPLAGRRPGKGWITAKRPARTPVRRQARLKMRSRYRRRGRFR